MTCAKHLACLCLLATSLSAYAGLKVIALGRLEPGLSAADERTGTEKKWQKVQRELGLDADKVVIKQVAGDAGGNTSVRHQDPLPWKDKGYYQRCRDLGQVFTAEQDFTLDAIVLRTGNANLAYLPGTAGAKVFVQFFEVVGTPVIDDNGTPPGSKATHGFSTNHRCDDFVTGVEYQSIRVAEGGVMPAIADVGEGKLTYLKWDLTGEDEIRCQAGRRYAFMVGFSEPAPERNFTLSNRNNANSPKPPSMDDSYSGGWGLRREGNGKTPPTMVPGAEPPADEPVRATLEAESKFPTGAARYAIQPTCDGYPDVCTYRDLEFYLLAR